MSASPVCVARLVAVAVTIRRGFGSAGIGLLARVDSAPNIEWVDDEFEEENAIGERPVVGFCTAIGGGTLRLNPLRREGGGGEFEDVL